MENLDDYMALVLAFIDSLVGRCWVFFCCFII